MSSNNNIEKWLICSDAHFPEQDKIAMNVILKFAKYYKPTHLAMLGDMISLDSVSKFTLAKVRKREGSRLKNDFEQLKLVLNYFNSVKSIQKKVFCCGNHENRLEAYLDNSPELEGLFSIKDIIQENGFEYVDYNKLYNVGKFVLTHGLRLGMNPASTTVKSLMKDCVFGHSHAIQCYYTESADGVKGGYNIGCLCDTNPDYNQNRVNRWALGFATLEYDREQELYSITLHHIENGNLFYNGKQFKG